MVGHVEGGDGGGAVAEVDDPNGVVTAGEQVCVHGGEPPVAAAQAVGVGGSTSDFTHRFCCAHCRTISGGDGSVRAGLGACVVRGWG